MKHHFYKRVFGFWIVFVGSLLLSTSVAQTIVAQTSVTDTSIRRAINFGNALEAANEGDWGMIIEKEYFGLVKDVGFDTVRLPIKWSAHAAEEAPYTIEPAFFARIDEVISWAYEEDLNIILDLHHYEGMEQAPEAHLERWLALWEQIAIYYQNEPESLYFEILNEPNRELGADLWNSFIPQALKRIRPSNPTRKIIVGPVFWNSIDTLNQLSLPDDSNLITTVHFYEPFAFTHQGAEWISPPPPVGTTWHENQVTWAAWDNWSWDTGLDFTEEGLEVTYQGGWAGLYLHRETPAIGYNQLHMRVQGARQLRVSCNKNEVSQVDLDTIEGWQDYEISLNGCDEGITDIFIMNDTPSPQASFFIADLSLEGPEGSMPLISNQADAIRQSFDEVAAWANANNQPIFLGEFGAYSPADMASRVRWTRFVREEAEARGFAWGYWEFGAGFGIYDRDSSSWREELLRALID